MAGPLAFLFNGAPVSASLAPGERLLRDLREDFGARDVKVGCNSGDCGAGTVLLDGAPVCSCLTPVAQAEGRHVETLAGLVKNDPRSAALAQSFQDFAAAQCGFCTRAMIVAATALLRTTSAPDTA